MMAFDWTVKAKRDTKKELGSATEESEKIEN